MPVFEGIVDTGDGRSSSGGGGRRGGSRPPAPAPASTESSHDNKYDRINLTRLTPYTAPEDAPPVVFGEMSMLPEPEPEPSLFEKFILPYSVTQLTQPQQKKKKPSKPEPRKPEATQPEPAQPRKPKGRRSYEMSWDDYMALTDDQRAAVDFNTLLIQAREKDLNADYKRTPETRKSYDKAVTEMFGEDGGSEVFAPETMALLEQIDFKATSEDDLDDFLSLKRTISEKELKNFKIETETIPVLNPDGSASPLITDAPTGESQLAFNTSRLQQEMARSNELLQNFRATFRLDRNENLSYWGGIENDPRIGLGYGFEGIRGPERAGFDELAQDVLRELAYKGNDPAQIWATVNAGLTEEWERKALMRYLDTRTRNAAAYGAGLHLEGDPKDYRTPEEFREMLGLDKKAGDRQ